MIRTEKRKKIWKKGAFKSRPRSREYQTLRRRKEMETGPRSGDNRPPQHHHHPFNIRCQGSENILTILFFFPLLCICCFVHSGVRKTFVKIYLNRFKPGIIGHFFLYLKCLTTRWYPASIYDVLHAWSDRRTDEKKTRIYAFYTPYPFFPERRAKKRREKKEKIKDRSKIKRRKENIFEKSVAIQPWEGAARCL